MIRRARRLSAPLAAAMGTTFLALCPAAEAGVLAPIWTGAYIGAQAGAKWANIDTDFNQSFSATDVVGGGYAGFNLALGALVVGIEGDASLDSSSLGFTPLGGGVGTLETDWSGTIRGRVGLPIGPALFYATAGYAWTENSITEKSSAGTTFSGSHSFNGVVYGLGVESFVLPSLSVRLEALRFDYGADSLSLSGAKGAVEEFDPSETVVRAGLTFHLN